MTRGVQHLDDDGAEGEAAVVSGGLGYGVGVLAGDDREWAVGVFGELRKKRVSGDSGTWKGLACDFTVSAGVVAVAFGMLELCLSVRRVGLLTGGY